ncbi:hypothetical protein [Thalassococcus lentus]|uniref:Phage tail collar domain-containing protein n=1 Tax=Thalassococcus lentus TaxID=1210524 RepID=A0ABT4XP33_9RHOB|nr:hypothetical protein [Thalassococcus lentus]MDA7423690.1 hypothetical protein [Thalassococcus lentus]
MTVISPRHATRNNPEAAGLEADIRHADGWPALSITGSPQLVEIVLTNRTPYPVFSDVARISLVVRPGVLTEVEEIALAPQSEANWSMAMSKLDSEDHDIRLTFDSAHRGSFAPGEARVIRLTGVSAAAEGGSRATRVELSFDRFFHAEGPEISGSHLLHLPILRRHGPDPLPMTEIRGGSAARSGPLVAGFVGGNAALNDGKSPNPLHLRVMNVSGKPLRLNSHGDEATRLHLGWEIGRPDGQWGLLSSNGDHLTLSLSSPQEKESDDPEVQELARMADKGWQIDGHTLRCTSGSALGDGDYIDLFLVVHSQAETGQAQLRLSYENLPDFDDGDLVVLVDLGPISATGEALALSKPLNLFGSGGKIEFHAAESFAGTRGEDENSTVDATVEVNRTREGLGQLRIDAPHGLDVPGKLVHPYNLSRQSQTFRVGGALNRYYPVLFRDLDWENGEFQLEIFRSRTHTDKQWQGSMMAQIKAHSSNWGHGSNYRSITVRQSGSPSGGRTKSNVKYRVFLGGFTNHERNAALIVWLAGNSSYGWQSNHKAVLDNLDSLENPGEVAYPASGNAQKTYTVKTAPDSGFNAPYVSIEKSFGIDTHPVPRGAIMMWHGKTDDIPLGWALCDGKDGRPDMIDRFVVGAAPENSGKKGEADSHTHQIFTNGKWYSTTIDGAHSHRFPTSWYKRVKDSGVGASHSVLDTGGNDPDDQTTRSSGDHSHKVYLPQQSTSASNKASNKNRPRWFALCFIIKL